MQSLCLITTLLIVSLENCMSRTVTRPKAVVVTCQSPGNSLDFRDRLRWRTNAEDHATIWLFTGEQLKINFYLRSDAIVEVLDVRYSNDGYYDDISLSLDDKKLGDFKTLAQYDWGYLWNVFLSSGPVGGQRFVKAGEHTVTLTVNKSDKYGVEIDYIRLNVHGSKVENLQNEHFFCEHNQRRSPFHAVR